MGRLMNEGTPAPGPQSPTTLQSNWLYRRRNLPAPMPDPAAYRSNRLIALATSPPRLLNYVRFRQGRRSASVTYLPARLDIENVSRCNLHCTMCQINDWPKFQRANDMSLSNFKRLIDSQYGLIEVKLQGMGEPLLGQDAFFGMIRYARSKHIWVRTSTNASLLHLNDNHRKLVDSGVNDLQISVDGACKETYEKIRQGANFERLKENCKLINGYCEARRLLRTRMWVMLQRDNIHELPDFVDLAAHLGFKRLTFAFNLHGWGQDKWNAHNEAVVVEDALTPEMALQSMGRGRRVGVEVTFWNNVSKYGTESPDMLCPWPFERAYISSDLRIVPCCLIANPQVSDLGDAACFATHWKGTSYQQFRQAHLDGRVPNVCLGCYTGTRS